MHVQNQVPLVGDHRTGLALSHAQGVLCSHGVESPGNQHPCLGQHLHRQRKPKVQPLHELAGVNNNNEAPGCCGHQFLLNVTGAATFDELEAGIHFVSAVNGQVDDGHAVQVGQGNATFCGKHLTLKRGRYTGHALQPARSQARGKGLDHECCRGTRAQTHHHPVFNLIRGGHGHSLFHAVLQVGHGNHAIALILASVPVWLRERACGIPAPR